MPGKFYSLRWVILSTVVGGAFLGLAGRIVYLGSVKRAFLIDQGAKRILRNEAWKACRGKILDRNGNVLAVSVEAPSVWVNPKVYRATEEQEEALSKIIGKPVLEIKSKIENSKREFVYLKRLVREEEAKRIVALKIPGIGLETGYRRYYPEGESMAPVIGITNIDDQGQEGLELTYEHWLRGIAGKNRVVKDCLGHVISDVKVLKQAEFGHDLVLSLDRRLQYFAYEELKNKVLETRAESGIIVVIAVKTGEILVMANYPSFDPNIRYDTKVQLARNRAVIDLYEPGSTLKPFTMLAALQSGNYTPNSLIDTSPGVLKIGKNIIRDSGNQNHGILTVSEILEKSSDVGTAKLVLALEPNALLDLLSTLGFGSRSTNVFPGEMSGVLPNNLARRPFVLATFSFGYSLSVTALQLANAYATLGSFGLKRSPTFLKTTEHGGDKVLPKEFCKQVLDMLEQAVIKGTGRRAKVGGYRVAGKTGTAHIASPKGGYYPDRYYASFAGVAPMSDPELAMVVVIRNPRGREYYGSQVAAPLFSKVMGGMLRILGIEFDAWGNL